MPRLLLRACLSCYLAAVASAAAWRLTWWGPAHVAGEAFVVGAVLAFGAWLLVPAGE